MAVDLRTSVEDALNLLPWTENRKGGARAPVASLASCDLVSDTQNSKGHLGMVRFLLSHVLTFGIDSETDILLSDHLKIKRPSRQFGKAVERLVPSFTHEPPVSVADSTSRTAVRLRLLLILWCPRPGASQKLLQLSDCCKLCASSGFFLIFQVWSRTILMSGKFDHLLIFLVPDTERYASQVILFYSTFLQEAVGPDFVFPSLECLADYWLDSSGEAY